HLFRRLSLVLTVLLVASRAASGAAAGGAAAADPGEALRGAASAGDLAKVQELLAAGVDVNAANSYGGTALAFACDRGHAAVVDLLLARGADVDVADRYYHSTPLSWAVERGHAEIVRSLLAKGAKGEAAALAAAAEGGHAAVVEVILERGKVPPEALSDALAAARTSEEAEIVALLEKAGAKPHPTVTVDPLVLASYAGAYAGEGLDITVAVNEGKLQLTSDRGMNLTFVAADPSSFRAQDVPGLRISFQVEAGKVTGVILFRGEDATPLQRKPEP
ncbi:MAG TPA: ankyrin repeat domain-containing protein, partial [Thermoanaerobaculia bacterium]|nr:ankyrin repeat domain-containing protein [Thermoanaerobaculia bacterium]